MRSLFLAVIISGSCQMAVDALDRSDLNVFLENHCYECHDDLEPEADLNLLATKFEPGNPQNFKVWEKVYRKIHAGEMPPKENKRPPKDELDAFLKTLGPQLYKSDRESISKFGRVLSRRLTREEYEYTLHDLLGVGVKLQESLTADPDEGFANTASQQQLSHFHLFGYLNAADLALDEAFSRALGKDPSFEKEYHVRQLTDRLKKGNYRGPQPIKNGVIAWSMGVQFYGRLPKTKVEENGWYEVTVHDAKGINRGEDGAVWATLNSGSGYSNEPLQFPIGLVEGAKNPTTQTFTAWIRKGHLLILKPSHGNIKRARSNVIGRDGGTVIYEPRNLEKEGYQGLQFRSISIKRIHPNGDRKKVFKTLFPGLTEEQIRKGPSEPEPQAERLLLTFANKAFRRPVSKQTVAPYLSMVSKALNSGYSFPDAIRQGYHAILCSPNFLTFIEKPGPLTDHAIAARLSYTLWKTLPDRELRSLANQGTLRNRQVHLKQIDRMLDDPRSSRFINSFAKQWLELRHIEATQPDPKRFRTFDPVLQQSMVTETKAFLAELFKEDLSIRNFLKSDFAFLNGRLKTHYNLKNVTLKPGEGLQRVTISPSSRSGLLTHGSILKITADGSVTSPIVRGIYVNERFLGQHIDPPPPNIPAIEPDIRGAISIRDQLDKHRNDPSCASCHVKIDPAGFALEEFDPIGNTRKFYGRPKKSAKVNSSGVTPDGNKFANFNEWRDLKLSRPEKLAEAFAGQLLHFATGSQPRFSDTELLKKIAEKSEKQQYGLRTILKETLSSPAFLEK